MISKVSIIVVVFALTLLLNIALISAENAVEPLWRLPTPAYNVTVSYDGNVVAIRTTNNEILVYDGSGTELWNYSDPSIRIESLKISKNGDVVVAAVSNMSSGGHHIVCWKNAKSLSGAPEPVWISYDLNGPIGRNALAVTADGNSVLAVGTGPNTFYWNNTLNIEGSNIYPTWTDTHYTLEYARISDDGNVVVDGGNCRWVGSWNGQYGTYYLSYVYYYPNSLHRTGHPDPEEYSEYIFPSEDAPSDSYLEGLDVSNDGKYFAAGFISKTHANSTLVYFKEGSVLWSSKLQEYVILDVRISGDGNVVAVSAYKPGNGVVYILFYKQATGKSGSTVTPDVVVNTEIRASEIGSFMDMDDEGVIVVFGSGRLAVALANDGAIVWKFDAEEHIRDVEISGNGKYAVIATGEIDSVFYLPVEYVPPSKPSKNIFEEIRRVLNIENETVGSLENLENLNASLDDLSKYISEGNYTYPFSEADSEGKVLNGLHEAYMYLKGLLIVKDIPPIPVGSDTYNELVSEYGSLLENYPSISGRLQLLYAILFANQ